MSQVPQLPADLGSDPKSAGSESDTAKDTNRRQFGANAANYATSETHAKGASLARLVELVEPQGHWQALDIATAAGHTAFAFAPMVEHVTATDLTPEMVELAGSRAREAGHDNVTTRLADAENLPFDNSHFDLVTCRIAPHHFADKRAFLSEVARVLNPGGTFALVDNVVPDNPEVALFCDDWEQRRDPSHISCLSLEEWARMCDEAGLTVAHVETAAKQMRFHAWANNMSVPDQARPQLLADLLDATPAVRAFLRPSGTSQEDAIFFLTEGLIVARR